MSCLNCDKLSEVTFLQEERERLIKKLEKIEQLAKAGWPTKEPDPVETAMLFRMICMESK